jgi:2-dehydropantoate 2-reductase
MRFVIVGPGALGSVFGVALRKRGHVVALLGRPTEHLQAIRNEGLRLESIDGTSEHWPIAATPDPAVVRDAETVIVLVKSVDTAAAMRAIRPHVRADLVVLTLQNGLGNAQMIRSALGEGPRVLVGVTSQAATRTSPGMVRHTGTGPTLIGIRDAIDTSIASQLATILSDAGLPAAPVADIDRWIWRKLALNAAINGLTALGDFSNGMIATDETLLDAAEIIAEEVASVARANGIELGSMRGSILETATATADNRSSMLQDLDAGRPTEVDAIHGAVLAAGQETGIATPATQVVAALVRVKEKAMTASGQIDGT